jgi:pimeloyl-ACP methyl ester carboxylesterase
MSLTRYYTSSEGYTAMMRWYNAALARFSMQYTAHHVATRYGETHVIEAGETNALPLVLLHGTNVNALTLKSQIIRLAPFYRIVAPDVPGFAGRSAPVRLPYRGDAYARWLLDVLDALDVSRALLVGASAGGFFALKAAAYIPERVAGLALVNPCGLVDARFPYSLFHHQAVASLVTRFGRHMVATQRTAQRLAQMSVAPTTTPDDESIAMTYLLLRYFRRHAPPRALPDDELSRVRAPVLLLLSDGEPFFDNAALMERAAHHFEAYSATRIAQAGHDLCKDHPDTVSQHVLDFGRGIGWPPRERAYSLAAD